MGNLDSLRDWGHARDYVEMQWLMLTARCTRRLCNSYRKARKCKKFIEITAKALNWGGIRWEGEGTDEKGYRIDNNQEVVRIDRRYFRPTEVEHITWGCFKSKRKTRLGPKNNFRGNDSRNGST